MSVGQNQSSSHVSYGKLVKRVYGRFPKIPPGAQHRHYAKWKLLTDPLYRTVREELEGNHFPTLDIGCGVGLLAFFLRETGVQNDIFGVDFDDSKIRSAQKVALQYESPPTFEVGDMVKPWPQVVGNVCLLDVLQYLDAPQREELLSRAALHVAPSGLLILRGSLQEDTWRWSVNVFMDKFANLANWMKAKPRSYPTLEELRDILSTQGLKLIRSHPLWGKTPFNMHFMVFQRPLDSAPSATAEVQG